MLNLNKTTIAGIVSKEPVVQEKFASFSVAVNEYWKDKNSNEQKNKSQFFNIITFDTKKFNFIKQYIKNGMNVYIEGKIKPPSIYTGNDGKQHCSNIQIELNEIKIIDNKNKNKNNDNDNYTEGTTTKYSEENDFGEVIDNQDEVPF